MGSAPSACGRAAGAWGEAAGARLAPTSRASGPTRPATSEVASATLRHGRPGSMRPRLARLLEMRATRGLSTPIARSSSPCAKTSCGVPSKATRPFSITTTRAQYSLSSATFCSMTTIVMPMRSLTWRRMSKTWRELAGSSAAVGSSSTSTRGSSARIAAMATFCFWPPERVAISRSRRSEMPTEARAPARRSSILSCGTPKFSRPKSISSSTTDATICASMSCSTLPTRREMSVSVTSQVSWPSTSVAPKSWPEKWCGMAPLITAASVDLPAPEGPMTPTNSPEPIESDTASSALSRPRS